MESNTADGLKCAVLVSESPGEFRLGVPFLKSYVTSFNYDESSVTFGVNVNAFEGTTILTETPMVTERDTPWVAIILFVLFIALLGIYCFLKRRWQKAEK